MKSSIFRTGSVLQGLTGAWRALLLAAAACTALLSACGGGGVGTGGTGSFSTSYASGTITGFGSVIVNGVRFDDTQSVVEEGDGTRRSRDDLKLGMTVDIDSGPISTDASGSSAKATRIVVASELLGLVSSVDAAAGRLTVLGQRVAVDVTTVIDDRIVGGLAGLAGATVQVYAVFDPALAIYRASRIEPSTSATWHLRGPLAAAPAGQVLRIGTTNYGYANAADVPAGLAKGQFVRLSLTAAGQPAGSIAVTRFGTALRALADADELKFKGVVSTFTSISSFSVNGRAVDASAAVFSPAGGAGLGLGARVEVEGVVRNGTLRASKVGVVTEQQERERRFELRGNITSVNPGAGTFVLRGQTVSTGRADLKFEGGNATDLIVNARVQVEGVLSSDGARLDATEIEFE